jgi:hypothetical protein
MAKRPVFVPVLEKSGKLVDVKEVEFVWHRGMSVTQKRKNIQALHKAAQAKGLAPLLEVSTKSELELGRALSAFNLRLKDNSGSTYFVEAVFQGSKVFERGGPYEDIYLSSGRDARSDPRLKNSGVLRKFRYNNTDWPLEPKTAFYDWLYLNALQQHPDLANQLLLYNAFTDIEFNPQKSYSTQARSCALYVALRKRNLLDNAMQGQDAFLDILSQFRTAKHPHDLQLF